MDSESAVKLKGDISTDLNVSITDWRSIPCLGNVEGDKGMTMKAMHPRHLEENTALSCRALLCTYHRIHMNITQIPWSTILGAYGYVGELLRH